MGDIFNLRAGHCPLARLRRIYERPVAIRLDAGDRARIDASSALVDRIVEQGDAAYGINTGFGLLAQTRIPTEQLEQLQRNLLLSHAAGVGEALPLSLIHIFKVAGRRGERTVGMVVDAVSDVYNVPVGASKPPPDVCGSIDTVFVKALATIADKLVILLDIDRLIDNSIIEEPLSGAAAA